MLSSSGQLAEAMATRAASSASRSQLELSPAVHIRPSLHCALKLLHDMQGSSSTACYPASISCSQGNVPDAPGPSGAAASADCEDGGLPLLSTASAPLVGDHPEPAKSAWQTSLAQRSASSRLPDDAQPPSPAASRLAVPASPQAPCWRDHSQPGPAAATGPEQQQPAAVALDGSAAVQSTSRPGLPGQATSKPTTCRAAHSPLLALDAATQCSQAAGRGPQPQRLTAQRSGLLPAVKDPPCTSTAPELASGAAADCLQAEQPAALALTPVSKAEAAQNFRNWMQQQRAQVQPAAPSVEVFCPCGSKPAELPAGIVVHAQAAIPR